MADIDISSISNGSNSADGLSGIILVTPAKTVGYAPQNGPSWQPNTRKPPRALVFNYEGENIADLSSDVTDHFIENNSAIQDQVALKPVQVKTQGFVGELNNVAPAALVPLQIAAEKLTVIGAFAPNVSVTAIRAYSTAFLAYQVAVSAVDLAATAWSTINGGQTTTVINGSTIGENGDLNGKQPNQTQQQKYFQQFYAYWKQRTLFTIQTPWAIFQDMVIMSVNAVQDADTDKISTFNVTFKQLRYATTAISTSANANVSDNSQGRLKSQASDPVNRGTSQLTPSLETFAGTFNV